MTDLDTLLRSSDVIAMLVSITTRIARECWRTRARVDETFGVPREYLARRSGRRRRALPRAEGKRIEARL